MDNYMLSDFRHIGSREGILIQKFKKATGNNKKIARMNLLKYRGIYEKETDSGIVLAINSRNFVEYLHEVFKVVEVSGVLFFYNWNLHYYEEISDKVYLRFFKQILDRMDKNLWNTDSEGFYHLLFKREIINSLKSTDMPMDCINFQNGVYYLKSDDFIEGDAPEKFFTYCLEFEYDSEARAPIFEGYVKDILNHDEDTEVSLQESLGLALDFDSHCQKIVYYGGTGANGKSTLINTLVYCLTIKNCATVSLKELLENDFIKSTLYQKMICVCSENAQDKPIDTSILKNVSGTDYVTINRKYKDPINAKLFTQIYLVSNDLALDDRSRAMERRLLAFKFCNYYTTNPRPDTNERLIDFDLQTKINSEIQGVFNYILEGYKRVRDRNWKVYESPAVKSYREELLEEANPVRMFINDCIVYVPKKRPKKKDIHNSFLVWCSNNGISPGVCSSLKKFYNVFPEAAKAKGLYYGEGEVDGYACYKEIDVINSTSGISGVSGAKRY